MGTNTYVVAAHFERSKFTRKVEFWQGTSRNMRTAIRAASQVILNRRNVKRLRHDRITFTIDKVKHEK
jgi:hypothetical protein